MSRLHFSVPAHPAPISTGRADFVWGVRMNDSQAAGSYSATVVFEALAPNV